MGLRGENNTIEGVEIVLNEWILSVYKRNEDFIKAKAYLVGINCNIILQTWPGRFWTLSVNYSLVQSSTKLCPKSRKVGCSWRALISSYLVSTNWWNYSRVTPVFI
jgi:hypothetical protein